MLKINYDFDIAALMILIVASCFHFKRKHVKDYRYILFSILLASAEITPIFDIIGHIMVSRGNTGPLFMVVDTIYYLSYQLTTYSFMVYVFLWIEMKQNISLSKKIRVFLPITISSFIIILNPFFGWFSAYGLDNYHRGILQEVCTIISLYYLAWAVVYVTLLRKILNGSVRYTVYNVAVLYTIPIICQLFSYELQLRNFGNALIIMLIMSTVQLHESSIDAVTGLMHKNHLVELCQKQIYNEAPFDVLMIRVADYELLTTSFGVQNTEKFMEEIGKGIQSFVRIGRGFKISNSTFAVIPPESCDADEMAKQIFEKLEKPWLIKDMEMVCSSFITKVSYPDNFVNLEGINAYLSYFQKMKHKRYGIIPAKELDVKDKIREAQVERAIKDGLTNRSFEVYYQPICIAENKSFVTAEALVRLTDPELGPISPAEFIPIAEKDGSIILIGNYVLDSVCEFVASHDMKALGLEYIELNLSSIQCLQRDFIKTIEDTVARHNIARKTICLEITETAANCAPAIFTQNLEKLKELGYKLALDDFGTGYGNLDRLTASTFDIIKFDRGLIQRTCNDKKLTEIFPYMLKMFHALDVLVVAEGVEDMEQYEFIRDSGGDYIQGFVFSKPLPEKDFIKYIEEHL